jgi:hypothetical protein
VFKVEDRFNVVMPDRRAEPPAQGERPAKRVWTLRVLATDLDALIAARKDESPATRPAP